MKKRIAVVLLPLAAIVLEMLPYGAVLYFAPSPDERVRATFSYFSLTPFGYASFGPLITAVLTCALLAAAVLYAVKQRKNVENGIFILSVVALITSAMPLMSGIGNYSLVGGLISVLLALEAWVSKAEF